MDTVLSTIGLRCRRTRRFRLCVPCRFHSFARYGQIFNMPPLRHAPCCVGGPCDHLLPENQAYVVDSNLATISGHTFKVNPNCDPWHWGRPLAMAHPGLCRLLSNARELRRLGRWVLSPGLFPTTLSVDFIFPVLLRLGILLVIPRAANRNTLKRASRSEDQRRESPGYPSLSYD